MRGETERLQRDKNPRGAYRIGTFRKTVFMTSSRMFWIREDKAINLMHLI